MKEIRKFKNMIETAEKSIRRIWGRFNIKINKRGKLEFIHHNFIRK